jgi:histidine triad (HIT) family protein
VLIDSDEVLAFRPDRPSFGPEHVIVVPKQHVRSLLELEPTSVPHLLTVIQQVAADVVARHGGCQVITTLGDEQHNRHLHFHGGRAGCRPVSPAVFVVFATAWCGAPRGAMPAAGRQQRRASAHGAPRSRGALITEEADSAASDWLL